MKINEIGMGRRIRMLREQRHASKAQLSQHLSISREQLSKLETGERLPSVITLGELAAHFHISTDYILFGTAREVNISQEIEYIISRLQALQQQL